MTDHPKAKQIFEKLCRDHDLTYTFSDDHQYWVRGRKSLELIQRFARDSLSPKVAAEIWNKMVDKKINKEGSPEIFYWNRVSNKPPL